MSNHALVPVGLSEAAIDQMVVRTRVLAEAARGKASLKAVAQEAGIGRMTLWRWRQRRAQGRSLVDARHTRSGRKSQIDARCLNHALAHLAAFPKASFTALTREVEAVATEQGWRVPSYGILRRALARLPADMVTMARDGFHETYYKTSLTVVRFHRGPGDLCQMDSTQLDLWVLDLATGEMVRPWLTTIIDCYSRCIIGLLIGQREPTATDTLNLLRQAILPKNRDGWPFYCLMRELRSDGAKCFRAKEVKEAVLRLGIVYEEPQPNSPNANGKQERFFLTFKQGLLTSLIGYTGQVAGLAKARKAAIPWPLVNDIVMRFLASYHTRVHQGIGCTPWERWMEGLDSAHGLTFDPAEVVDALKVRVSARVSRHGVKLPGGRRYSSPKLVGLVGRTIEVRIDASTPADRCEAYLDGEPLVVLEAWDASPGLGEKVAAARLHRIKELKKFRRDLRRFTKTAPPITTAATRLVRIGDPAGSQSASHPSPPPHPKPNPTSIPKLSRED